MVGSKQEKNAVAVGKTTFAERVRIFQSLTGRERERQRERGREREAERERLRETQRDRHRETYS